VRPRFAPYIQRLQALATAEGIELKFDVTALPFVARSGGVWRVD